MKKMLLVFLLLPTLIFGQTQPADTVSKKELDGKDDGLLYKRGSETPYTGILLNWYSNGKKWAEGSMVNGKPEGLFTEWDENGRKSSEAN